MRAARVAALVAAVLLVAGCSEIPTSGPVQAGSTEGPNDTTIVYLPPPPAAGASQREIVTGFLSAASAGGDFRVAKEYLTSGFAETWQPQERVLVQEAQPKVRSTSSSELTLQIPISARVEANGVYRPSSSTVTLDFHLAREGGQWRIDDAPDGIVLGESVFGRNYRPGALEFFDPSYTRLVPDLRWFPAPSSGLLAGRADAASVIDALIAGPAGPLSGGVAVNALQGATVDAVETEPGDVTTVELSVPGGPPSSTVIGRMQQQLIRSLPLATPSALRLIVNGRIASPVKALVNQPTSLNAYVVLDGRFGTLTSTGTFTEERTLGKRIVDLRPRAVTVSVRQGLAAVLTEGREVAVVTPSGSRVVDRRSGLVDPTLDQRGWVYSVPAQSPGRLIASDQKGNSIALVADLGGNAVTAIEVSPDGTRLLALVQSAAGPTAFVVGIERDDDGTPTALTTSKYEVALDGTGPTGLDATWVDDGSVAVLVGSPDIDRVFKQQLGGVGLPLGQLPNAVSIVGTSSSDDLRIRLQTGALLVYSSPEWQSESGAGEPVAVEVLAVQR